jgi:adenylate kinase
MKVIAITGTPGTGKSALARELSLLLHYQVIDVASFIKQHRLSDYYDRKRRCYVVDTKKLNKAIIKAINHFKTQNKGVKGLIIDSHMSHFLPRQHINLCIVTKCSVNTLKKRLTSKGYSKAKVRENLDAEIFDTCLVEAEQKKHNVLVVDTTEKSAEKTAKIILPKIP